ncbi:MAG TPA: hypothetical protein VIV40_25280 [Kofleriaceae bacterium]
MRRELALVFGARVTWLVAAISALLVGHGFVLAIDLFSAASRSALGHQLLQRELDPLAGIVGPTLGGLYLATALLLPVIAVRGLAVEKERRSYGALALRAGATHRIVLAKLVAAFAAAALLLLPPLVLFVAYAIAGGHLDAIETLTAVLGHALDLALIVAVSLAAAAATRTVAQATVLAIALSLGSWAIDASGELAALAWMGSLEWASIGRRLAPFEHGIFHLGSLAWLLVASASAATCAVVVGRIEHTMRRWWIASGTALVTLVLLALLGRVQRGYDWSEERRQSFPAEIVEAMRALPGDLTLDVWLDRDDGRRTELERGPLAKLVLARPDADVRMPLDRDASSLAARDADYGRIVIEVGNETRETRSSADEELVRLIFDAARRPMPAWVDPPYPGYPFVIDGTARTTLAVLAYLVVPIAFVALGLFFTRSRRRS